MAVIYNTSIIINGLVFYFDTFNRRSYPENKSGWNDLVGTRTVSLFNGVNTSSSNFISFDGLNDMGIISDTGSLAWTPDGSVGFQNMTLDVWIRSSDTVGRILSRPWNGSGQYNFGIAPNLWRLESGASGTTSTIQTFARNLSNGNWVNIVCWANSTTMGYRINYNEHTASISHGLSGGVPSSGNSNLNIGLMTLYPYGNGWAGNTDFSLLGDLSSVKYYNRVLTTDEIQQNFNAARGRYGI
jgi:hypothetical protein